MDEKMFESILNVGSNLTSGGVLLFILYFLYHNVPTWINQHFKMIEQLTVAHKEESKETNTLFADELREERRACREDNARIADVVERSNEAHLKAVETMTAAITSHHLYAVQKMTELGLERHHDRHPHKESPPSHLG
jgi:hypothetical protein